MNALVDQSAQNAVMNNVDADPFATAGASASGQTTYVKFKGASGEYLAGQDEEEINHGTEFAADIMNAKWIWSFWWDGKVLETVDELLINDPKLNERMPDFLPDNDDIDMTLDEIKKMQKDDPANFRDGWSVQASFNMRPLDGSDEEFTMRLGGMVSLNAFAALCKAFGRRYKLEAGKLPIIELTTNKYKSKVKGVGTRHAPVLKIVRWESEADLLAAAGEDDGDYGDMDPDDAAALPAPDADQVDDAAQADEAAEPAEEAPAARRGRRGARGKNLG